MNDRMGLVLTLLPVLASILMIGALGARSNVGAGLGAEVSAVSAAAGLLAPQPILYVEQEVKGMSLKTSAAGIKIDGENNARQNKRLCRRACFGS